MFWYNGTKRLYGKSAAEKGIVYEKEIGAWHRACHRGVHAVFVRSGLSAADDGQYHGIGGAGGLAELSQQGGKLVQQQRGDIACG